MNKPEENPMRPIGEALIFFMLIWAAFFASCIFAHLMSTYYPALHHKIVVVLVWVIEIMGLILILLMIARGLQSIFKHLK